MTGTQNAAPRPPVSVVVPFRGNDLQLQRIVDHLHAVATRPGDEVIVADNDGDRPRAVQPGRVIIHPAGPVPSAGYARNRGAAAGSAPWIVFIDADTDPEPDLLDAYFDPPPADRTAVIGGAILDVLPGEGKAATLAAQHLVERRHMSHGNTLDRPSFPYAQTANCAVRREALVAVGGFDENFRGASAEDADLCFRLAARGWGLESRPHAVVRHAVRGSTRDLLTQLFRHGAGAGWCDRQHPGSFPRPSVQAVAARVMRAAARSLWHLARGQWTLAAFAGLEMLETLAFELGRLLPSRARR